MGLGSAISLQAKYRIVTERSIYAMPEVSIGYFPDASTCYTFSRLRNHIGYLLGVTGYKLKGIYVCVCYVKEKHNVLLEINVFFQHQTITS